jgi:hypothetical protein
MGKSRARSDSESESSCSDSSDYSSDSECSLSDALNDLEDLDIIDEIVQNRDDGDRVYRELLGRKMFNKIKGVTRLNAKLEKTVKKEMKGITDAVDNSHKPEVYYAILLKNDPPPSIKKYLTTMLNKQPALRTKVNNYIKNRLSTTGKKRKATSVNKAKSKKSKTKK